MIYFEGSTATDVWVQAMKRMEKTSALQESRDQKTRELLHAGFTISDPRQRIVFPRLINPAFAIAEVLWILSGANDAAFLKFWNPRIMLFSDDQKIFHGAYGFRLGSQPKLQRKLIKQLRHENKKIKHRVDQIKSAYEALKQTPYSRQVVLQIWNHLTDLPDPNPRSKDIPCNIVSHLMVRNGKLEWLQVMRSNDLIWGTPYNFIQFTTIQEIMAGWLGVDVGTYNHISDSLHVYERHWELLENFNSSEKSYPKNSADLRINSYQEWEKLWSKLINAALRLAEYKEERELLGVKSELKNLPDGYKEWIALLTAEALRRRGYKERAQNIIQEAGSFWSTSWLQWARSVEETKKQKAA